MTLSAAPTALLPQTCAIAFKEWSGVCDALASGRQSVILRKGGIAEAAGRFVPEHRAFWLYPTHVHEIHQGLRKAGPTPEPGRSERPGEPVAVAIRALVEVVTIAHFEALDPLERLADLHVWTEETVRKRFHFRRPGLWVLGVRVHVREAAWNIAVTPEHSGCKTWVTLEEPLSTWGLTPALGADELARRLDRLRELSVTGEIGKGGPSDG
jgi:hypothetical protein